MTRLPPQPWQDSPGVRRILAALDADHGRIRVVGGAVRDGLLGRAGADVDFATPFAPDVVMERLKAAGLKVIPTGIDHGTVTAVADHHPYEITTLRRDVATDGRRATIAYTDDWREDAARRDFTINALSADPLTGTVYDYFDGLADLAAHRVRFIGDPYTRIAEDHLRILRFFRFHARFGHDSPDPAGLAACVGRARDLMALSRERIRDELLKLLAAEDPVATVRLMTTRGIFTPVLPEITADHLDAFARLVGIERALGDVSDLRRLAALLPADAGLLDDIARRLRLSNAERKRLVAMAERWPQLPADLADIRARLYRLGGETVLDRALLSAPDAEAVAPLRTEVRDWTPPRLPIGGRDIMALGVPHGPAVAATLRAIEDRWIAAGFPADREALLALARESVTG